MAFVDLGTDVCQSRGRTAEKFRVDFVGVNLFCDSINWLGLGISLSLVPDRFASVRGRSILFKSLAIQWKRQKTNLLGYLLLGSRLSALVSPLDHSARRAINKSLHFLFFGQSTGQASHGLPCLITH